MYGDKCFGIVIDDIGQALISPRFPIRWISGGRAPTAYEVIDFN
jgi:hypothetical protein